MVAFITLEVCCFKLKAPLSGVELTITAFKQDTANGDSAVFERKDS